MSLSFIRGHNSTIIRCSGSGSTGTVDVIMMLSRIALMYRRGANDTEEYEEGLFWSVRKQSILAEYAIEGNVR